MFEFHQKKTGHLVYGLGYHAGSHARQIAKVADSATVCASYSHVINSIAKVIMQCLPLVLNGYNVIVMIMSLFFFFFLTV